MTPLAPLDKSSAEFLKRPGRGIYDTTRSFEKYCSTFSSNGIYTYDTLTQLGIFNVQLSEPKIQIAVERKFRTKLLPAIKYFANFNSKTFIGNQIL